MMNNTKRTVRLPLLLSVVIGAGLIVSGVGCPAPPPAPECTTDADCPQGQRCDGGQCVTIPPECEADDDCEADEVCLDEECAPAAPYETHEFDHEAHSAAFSCDTCHHAGIMGCDASGCHAEEWIAGVPSLKDAKHNPDGGCRSCHNETTEDGLWDCTQCHTGL
ncbi:MAG: cytochrome c3 family protein [Phycisphaerales bacterium]|nr:MAG: cytochrome c3 family protein [Phycisphaerales bacterium]